MVNANTAVQKEKIYVNEHAFMGIRSTVVSPISCSWIHAIALELDQSQSAAAEIAPLLCAGLIGYRSLRYGRRCPGMSGFMGSGSAAHICHPGCSPGKIAKSTHLRDLAMPPPKRSHVSWVQSGRVDLIHRRPRQLDAALIFAPDGRLVPKGVERI